MEDLTLDTTGREGFWMGLFLALIYCSELALVTAYDLLIQSKIKNFKTLMGDNRDRYVNVSQIFTYD